MRRSTRVAIATALATATFSFSVTPAEAAPPSTYVVVSGDSLFGISKKLGVRFADLLSANSMTATSVILPGQQLVVPGATPPSPAAGGTYTVKAGDSLGRIALRHGVSLSALLSVNEMTAKSLILAGQTLTLPAGAPTSAQPNGVPANAPAAGGSYIVKAGDSLGRIASRHGVSLSALLSLNGMTAKSLILPGQTITLPAGASTTAQPNGTPANAPAAGGSYIVKTGDSLGRIASKHGVSLSALLSVNGMTAKSLILPGQTITLPAGATTTAQPNGTPANAPAAGGSYIVKAGDSLGRIASRHGVSLSALLSLNGMTAKSLILPGQTITLPAGATTTAQPNGTPANAPAAGGSYIVKAGDSL